MTTQYLFGDPLHVPKKPHGVPAPLASGPDGETCGSCRFAVKVQHQAGSYYKCELMERYWTHGAGTDIRLKWPACKEHQQRKDVNDENSG